MQKRKIVVDSSVAIKWLHERGESFVLQADKVMKKAQKNEVDILMPQLAQYEIGNALLYKNLELPLIQRLIERFYVLPIEFVSEDFDLSELTVEIAYKNKITYYDASFMALAKEQNATLITDNPKHQGKKIAGLKVIPLKDYR